MSQRTIAAPPALITHTHTHTAHTYIHTHMPHTHTRARHTHTHTPHTHTHTHTRHTHKHTHTPHAHTHTPHTHTHTHRNCYHESPDNQVFFSKTKRSLTATANPDPPPPYHPTPSRQLTSCLRKTNTHKKERKTCPLLMMLAHPLTQTRRPPLAPTLTTDAPCKL